MSGQLDEAAYPFRTDLHIAALRAAAHSSTWSREGLGEKLVYIFPQLLNPRGGKSVFVSNDAIPINTAHDTGYIALEIFDWTYDGHNKPPTPSMQFAIIDQ
jgi:hypothetical protein